ncbi:MAG: hypothetical protein Ct9H300mP1_01160 [Planctomycetaceae bacterium]|nr:MAG: hypothetical protein Ct9H300mP1_01160 [Planctomycetaceae bacterium]
MTVDKDALLASDHAHLIHPLHNKAGHQDAHSGSGVTARRWSTPTAASTSTGFPDSGMSSPDTVARNWAQAASRQMTTLPYCSGYTGSSNPNAIALAERLARLTYPSINRFFFTSGGGESRTRTSRPPATTSGNWASPKRPR